MGYLIPALVLACGIHEGGHYVAARFLAVPIFYAVTLLFWVWYAGEAVAHLGLYRVYAGEESDFRWV